MSRRKAFARSATDRAPSDLASPIEIRRLFDAMLSGLRDASFGTEIGRLHLSGRLTASEVATAKRWSELVVAYSAALRGPRGPSSVQFDANIGSMPSDPDSEVGRKEAKKHARAELAFLDGRNALRKAGRGVENVVEDVVVKDLARTSFEELIALRAGLQALSKEWSSKRKGAR